MRLSKDFLGALKQITSDRSLSSDLIADSLKAAMQSAYRKYRGGNQEAEVNLDFESGEITVSELREVVKEVSDPDTQITPLDARKDGFIKPKVGDLLRIKQNPEEFGRIAAQTARQVIMQKLKDAERKVVYDEFADKIGEMMNGIIAEFRSEQIIVRLNERTDAIFPREERISGEKYRLGDQMKFYVLEVRQTARGPRIVVSRTHPGLLRKLLELEVPEIREGIVEIKSIAREGGVRAKVAVISRDPNVDPVGACVGSAGDRVKYISGELCGEKIDAVLWSEDPITYVRNALSPAKVAKIEPMPEQERAVHAYVYPGQLSLAIGKLGQNVRLSSRLTGWKIDITTVEAERMPTLSDIFHDFPVEAAAPAVTASDIFTDAPPKKKTRARKKDG
ncbi:MAG: transcription termination factor NusA [Synergistaceae bacterium]|jgi:N utilization substance protein A|nr:transcription termination factor NusA [Synergistaceae bacterium]